MLLDDLLCPTTVTIGVDRLIHATGFASGLNSAGWVKLSDLTKGNISFPVPVSEIPGLVGNTSGAYAAVNNSSATYSVNRSPLTNTRLSAPHTASNSSQ